MNISELLSLLEYKVIWPLEFSFYKLIYKVDDKTVLFADPYATDLTDNMIPIYAALSEKDGLNLVKCFASKESGNKIKRRLLRSKQYSKFLKAYASAGTVFLTESMLPAFAVKRR
ncbi:MAG: hypothetical protein Q4F70_06490, partial [Clostridia bacterium]|nr:hypothetical protein [Clostridia bacterium]